MAIVVARRLDNAIWWYWLFIFVFTTSMLFYRGWTPTAAIYRHSYVLSSPPGSLTTERWSRPFVEDVLSVLLWLIPITAAFMISKPAETWMHPTRSVMLFILFAYFTVVFGFGIHDWVNCNKTHSGNFQNPANDDRWCCIYYNLPGAQCENVGTDANDGPCVPGIGAGDLSVNKDFLYKFWFNFALLLFIVFDFFYMLLVYRQEVYRYSIQLAQHTRTQPLIPK